MIKKYLKKSTALTLAAFTILTNNCISNINAADTNNEKPSTVNKYLKYAMAYTIPCAIILANGIGIGKHIDLRTRNEKLDILKMLENYNNISLRTPKEDIIKLVNNALGGTAKHKKFERHTSKNVMVIKNFYNIYDIDTELFLNNLKNGTTLVFLGNIVGRLNRYYPDASSLRNIIYLAELQKLYPEQVIILKGQNEIYDESKNTAQEYLRCEEIYSKELEDKIKQFIDNLPIACEIADKDDKEKVCLFSYYTSSTYCEKGEEISRKCFLEGKIKIYGALSTLRDSLYKGAGFNQYSIGRILNNQPYIRKISIDEYGIKTSEID